MRSIYFSGAIMLAIALPLGFTDSVAAQLADLKIDTVWILHDGPSSGGGGVRGFGGGDNLDPSKIPLYREQAKTDAFNQAQSWIDETWSSRPENSDKLVFDFDQSADCPGNRVANFSPEDGGFEYWIYVIDIYYFDD